MASRPHTLLIFFDLNVVAPTVSLEYGSERPFASAALSSLAQIKWTCSVPSAPGSDCCGALSRAASARECLSAWAVNWLRTPRRIVRISWSPCTRGRGREGGDVRGGEEGRGRRARVAGKGGACC